MATIIYDVILKRGCKSRPDVTIFYDEDKEKSISEMLKYVKKHGFSIDDKDGTFSIANVILREREATGKEISRTPYCEIFNPVTQKRILN